MTAQVRARGGAREVSISAVVTRADGRVEDLGVISLYSKNPLKMLAFRVRQWLRRVIP